MLVIESILYIVETIAFGLVSSFAAYAFYLLRHMEKTMTALEELIVTNIAKTTCIELMLMDIKAEKMTDTINELIASEEYEKAERMNEIRFAIRQSMEKTVEAFNRNFGKVAVLSIKTADGKETKRDEEKDV